MKRKTNLFYNSGVDSKFLTFSNYTDSLTGNFLSVNTKLFPSAFLCLNIPRLTTENKKTFINTVLISKYENKMAVLRDSLNETELFPLQYLLEYIYEYDPSFTIPYIGNITEQDYLGSYTDTICLIDTSNIYKASIENTGNDKKYIVSNDLKLYGWYDGINNEYTGPSEYSNLYPFFDLDNSKYCYTNNLNIKYSKDNVTNLSFNVVIPLYSMVYTDLNEPINEIYSNNIEEENILDNTYNRNVPLGIWFADKNIELITDEKYGQTWSLVIGSQFKPLPTSPKVRSDIYKDSSSDAFKTFAQILTRQNELLDKIESYNKILNDMNKRLIYLESKLKNN